MLAALTALALTAFAAQANEPSWSGFFPKEIRKGSLGSLQGMSFSYKLGLGISGRHSRTQLEISWQSGDIPGCCRQFVIGQGETLTDGSDGPPRIQGDLIRWTAIYVVGPKRAKRERCWKLSSNRQSLRELPSCPSAGSPEKSR